MSEILAGVLIGWIIGARQGWTPDVSLGVGVLLGVGLYLASCWRRPFHEPCPWCEGRSTKRAKDSRGNFRRAADCWVCGGRDYVRLGARLLGRG